MPQTTTCMSNMILTDGGAGFRRLSVACLAPLLLLAQAACSAPNSVSASNLASSDASTNAIAEPIAPSTIATTNDFHPTGAPAPAPSSDANQTASRVIGKHDQTLADGKRSCDVDFVYAGQEHEDVFWHEPCNKVTAKMVTRSNLEAMGRWDRLDSFQQKFVEQMPGGKVLYIEGGFSASVYPVDETGTSIEVAVAD